MKSNSMNMSKTISYVCAIIIFLEIICNSFFPNITFINGTLVTLNKIMGFFVFSLFIILLFKLFKANKIVTIIISLLLFIIFIFNSYAEINPIDTTTPAVEIKTLQRNEDGSKIIVQKSINMKIDEAILDTILVNDFLIFRRIINQKTDKNPVHTDMYSK